MHTYTTIHTSIANYNGIKKITEIHFNSKFSGASAKISASAVRLNSQCHWHNQQTNTAPRQMPYRNEHRHPIKKKTLVIWYFDGKTLQIFNDFYRYGGRRKYKKKTRIKTFKHKHTHTKRLRHADFLVPVFHR